MVLQRGAAGDLVADIVIGKPDFATIAPHSVNYRKLYNPGGCIIDHRASPQVLYVVDAGNNRILAVNWDAALADPDNVAQHVLYAIGQPNSSSAAANGDSGWQNYPHHATPTPSSLNLTPDYSLSPDEGGCGLSLALDNAGTLYVTDYYNNRVVSYLRGTKEAAMIWTGARFPSAWNAWGFDNNGVAGVDVDQSGDLWVTENALSTVRRLTGAPLRLGYYSSPGSDLSHFRTPTVVRGLDDGTLLVADAANQRILRFRPPFSDGMAGEVWGSWRRPLGIDRDPTMPGHVWVYDGAYVYLTRHDGTVVRKVGNGDANLISGWGSVGVDKDGNVAVPVNNGASRHGVLVFNKDTTLRARLFSPDYTPNVVNSTGLGNVTSVAVLGDQVVVGGQGRILFWNGGVAALTNGKPADGWLSNITQDRTLTSFSAMDGACCSAMTADKQGHLWVATFPDRGWLAELVCYQWPLTPGAVPVKRLRLPLLFVGGGIVEYSTSVKDIFWGLAVSPDGNELWVTQKFENRAFRIRDPLGTAKVDAVIGGLDKPGGIALDAQGNVWISNHSLEVEGGRDLRKYAAPVPMVNAAPIHVKPNVATWQPAFGPGGQLVVGYNRYGPAPNTGAFVGVYDDPLSLQPSRYLADYQSMALSCVFDDAGNLLVGDLNRNRVAVYLQPFGVPPSGEPAPVPTPTPDTTAPIAPTGINAGYHQFIEVAWSAVSDADHYRVYRGSTKIATVRGATVYRDTNIKSRTSYAYKVTAVDAAGNESLPSLTVRLTTPYFRY